MPAWTREDREEKAPIYWYDSVPGPITLEGIQVRQKGRVFYVVAASAMDLDRLCSVPVLPYSSTNSDVATAATATYIPRWQRQLDGDRSKEIAAFFSGDGNWIVNAALIGLPRAAVFHSTSGLRASCSIPVTWLKRQCTTCHWSPPSGHPYAGKWFDACPNCTWEGRPGQLIDGQHRVRGCAAAGAPVWDEPLVASVLVEDQFSSTDDAKIFSEITTSAVDLHALHKVFLLYKFGLRGTEVGALKDADFRTASPPAGSANTLGLRNRRAYEIACELVRNTSSRWVERVSMFPGDGGRARKGDVIDVDVLVGFIEQWLQTGPFDRPTLSDGMISVSDASAALRNFLEAALSVWPAGVGTPSGTSSSFWNDTRTRQGWLQLRGIFEIFLSLFEITSRRIQSRGNLPTKPLYMEELSYIETINWDDSCWHDLAAPDKNKYLLRRVLSHLYAQAPNPIGVHRVNPSVNQWMKDRPDTITFTSGPAPAPPLASVTSTSPLTFGWSSTSPYATGPVPKPVNAYDTAIILLEQDQAGGRTEVLDQFETILTRYSISSPPRGMDANPGAPQIRISVRYNNLNGNTTSTFYHPAV